MKQALRNIVFCALCLIFVAAKPHEAKKILILGDSITAGYGVEPEMAYPSLLEKLLHANGHPHITIVNGGMNGATTATGATSFEQWYLRSKPNVLVLALGANDGLRGIAISETKKNLLKIIRLAKTNGIEVLLTGMLLPPNYGKPYTKEFAKIFSDLAKSENLVFMPFLLKDVGGQQQYNLPDGIHPNIQGHQKIATNVLPYLQEILQ